MSLGGSLAEPSEGFLDVLLHAPSVPVHCRQPELAVRRALLSRLLVPIHGLSLVLFNAFPFPKHVGDAALRNCISLLGGLAKPSKRFREIPADAGALVVGDTQIQLADHVTA